MVVLLRTLTQKNVQSLPFLWAVRMDFSLTVKDQFGDPVADAGVQESVHRENGVDFVNVAIQTGTAVTDASGKFPDQQLQQFWSSSGWVNVFQALRIGNWE